MKKKDVFKVILDKGVRCGTITYDEITDALPVEFFSLDKLEDLIDRLKEEGVRVIDYKKRRN